MTKRRGGGGGGGRRKKEKRKREKEEKENNVPNESDCFTFCSRIFLFDYYHYRRIFHFSYNILPLFPNISRNVFETIANDIE